MATGSERRFVALSDFGVRAVSERKADRGGVTTSFDPATGLF